MRDALGRPTQYVYDALDRRTRIIFADNTEQISKRYAKRLLTIDGLESEVS